MAVLNAWSCSAQLVTFVLTNLTELPCQYHMVSSTVTARLEMVMLTYPDSSFSSFEPNSSSRSATTTKALEIVNLCNRLLVDPSLSLPSLDQGTSVCFTYAVGT